MLQLSGDHETRRKCGMYEELEVLDVI